MSQAAIRDGTVPVGERIEVFRREAGDPAAPAILLLHGFPTSSHMFRNLIPLLAGSYRVVAPDLPGFGQTHLPQDFRYTFANLADVIGKFVRAIGLDRFALYVFTRTSSPPARSPRATWSARPRQSRDAPLGLTRPNF